MFKLNSNISIGNYKRVKPIEVNVENSIFSFITKAYIKVPAFAKEVKANVKTNPIVEVAKRIKEGDAVSIELGYNGELKTEFVGFVSRLNYTSPIELVCEGYSYLLRKRTYKGKTIYKTPIREVLKYLLAGTPIVLDDNIPDYIVDKLPLSGQNGVEVLLKIKKDSHDALNFVFIGHRLYCGLMFTKSSLFNVKYKMGWNVIDGKDFKLREASNDDVTVIFHGEKKDGTKETISRGGNKQKKAKVTTTVAEAGTSGETKIFTTHAINDKNTLSMVADAKHFQLTYSGFEGKIVTFLQPFIQPLCSAIIDDPKFPARSGKYICTSVNVSYGVGGARRTVEIGYKLD